MVVSSEVGPRRVGGSGIDTKRDKISGCGGIQAQMRVDSCLGRAGRVSPRRATHREARDLDTRHSLVRPSAGGGDTGAVHSMPRQTKLPNALRGDERNSTPLPSSSRVSVAHALAASPPIRARRLAGGGSPYTRRTPRLPR